MIPAPVARPSKSTGRSSERGGAGSWLDLISTLQSDFEPELEVTIGSAASDGTDLAAGPAVQLG